jgi:hypothetical protein
MFANLPPNPSSLGGEGSPVRLESPSPCDGEGFRVRSNGFAETL